MQKIKYKIYKIFKIIITAKKRICFTWFHMKIYLYIHTFVAACTIYSRICFMHALDSYIKRIKAYELNYISQIQWKLSIKGQFFIAKLIIDLLGIDSRASKLLQGTLKQWKRKLIKFFFKLNSFILEFNSKSLTEKCFVHCDL